VTEPSDTPNLESRQVEAFEPLPGDLLVSARRARGLSTAKAAESLNLDESVVLALEENRFESLGAPVFARGHLRKYARLLALDPDTVIRAYDAIATEQSAASLSVTPTVEKSRRPVMGQRALWIVLAVAVLASAIVVWRVLQNGDAPTAESDQPTARVVEAEPAPAPADPNTGPTEQASAPGGAAADSPLQSAAVAIPVEPAPQDVPAADSTQSEAPQSSQAVEAPDQLVFSFDKDSWLDVRDGQGRRLAYEMGRRGTQRTITGQAPFQVFLGNWSGVTIAYGGETFSVPASARQGNTARFSIPDGNAD
jgi:cytoskeleton protein RodZ